MVFGFWFFVLCVEVDRGRGEELDVEKGEKVLKFKPKTQTHACIDTHAS